MDALIFERNCNIQEEEEEEEEEKEDAFYLNEEEQEQQQQVSLFDSKIKTAMASTTTATTNTSSNEVSEDETSGDGESSPVNRLTNILKLFKLRNDSNNTDLNNNNNANNCCPLANGNIQNRISCDHNHRHCVNSDGSSSNRHKPSSIVLKHSNSFSQFTRSISRKLAKIKSNLRINNNSKDATTTDKHSSPTRSQSFDCNKNNRIIVLNEDIIASLKLINPPPANHNDAGSNDKIDMSRYTKKRSSFLYERIVSRTKIPMANRDNQVTINEDDTSTQPQQQQASKPNEGRRRLSFKFHFKKFTNNLTQLDDIRECNTRNCSTTGLLYDCRSFEEKKYEINDFQLIHYMSTKAAKQRRHAICSRIDKLNNNRVLVDYMEYLLREDYIKNFLL